MHCFWNNVTENRSDILACGYEWPQSFSWQCVSVSGEAQTRRTHTERTQLCDTSSQQKEAMQMSNQLWAMRQNALCSRCHSFTFMHLADAFIQSDLQCIQAIHLYCQYMCSLGIEPTTFALLTQCSTTEPQEHEFWVIRQNINRIVANSSIVADSDYKLSFCN